MVCFSLKVPLAIWPRNLRLLSHARCLEDLNEFARVALRWLLVLFLEVLKKRLFARVARTHPNFFRDACVPCPIWPGILCGNVEVPFAVHAWFFPGSKEGI